MVGTFRTKVFEKPSQLSRLFWTRRWTLRCVCALAGLAAAAPVAAQPQPQPQPPAFKIVDPLTMVRSAEDVQNAKALDTVTLVGPRNGTCSAPVYVSGAAEIGKPDLQLAAGSVSPSRIPAESILVRYAALDSPYKPKTITNDPWLPEQSALAPYYDVLQPQPPAAPSDVNPVWLTVRIPKDQAPGLYEGTLTINGAKAPVRLTVSDWVCPDPRDWTSGVQVMHSPESLVERYGVELWSDKHWALVEQELRNAAALGSKLIEIPIYPGNEVARDPWVFFRQKGDAIEVDFSVVDKYLALVSQTIGQPSALIVMAWDSRRFPPANANRDPRRKAGELTLTYLDEQGKQRLQDVPSPGQPGAEPPYQALFDGLRERVKKLGWDEKTILVGWATDRRPSEEVVAFFQKVAPYARWAIITHGRSDKGSDKQTGAGKWDGTKEVIDGMEIGYHVHPFAPTIAAVMRPADGVVGGWDLSPPRFFNARVYMYQAASLTQYRSFPGGAVCLSKNQWSKDTSTSAGGLATIPLDFWENEKGSSLLGRYDRSGWTEFHRWNTYWLIAPGPDGPIGTTRYEMLREGLQETEARIEIEKAIAQKEIPDVLASECTALLVQRMNVQWLDGKFANSNNQWQKGGMHDYQVGADWQASTAQLFAMAGKVAAAHAAKP